MRGRHKGETAWVVGKGPSLLRLEARHIGAGPVFAINDAILRVRELGLPNLTYTTQKDAGSFHGWAGIHPIPPEILMVSGKESLDAFTDYAPRLVVDAERDASLPSWSCSSIEWIAATLQVMGVARVVLISFDAVTRGDARKVIGGTVRPASDPRGRYYKRAGARAAQILRGVPVEWLTPA
jgi:hypothetical protein